MTSFGGEIPVIDISHFSNGSSAGCGDVVRTLSRACEEIGFFILQGHGVSEQLVAHMAAVSRAFFDLPAKGRHDAPGGIQHVAEPHGNRANVGTGGGRLHVLFGE